MSLEILLNYSSTCLSNLKSTAAMRAKGKWKKVSNEIKTDCVLYPLQTEDATSA